MIKYCNKCEEYTLKSVCKCGGRSASKKPAKFNPGRDYSKERLKLKKLL